MSRVLLRDGALADGRGPDLRLGVSVLIDDGVVRWIRPVDGEEDPGPLDGLTGDRREREHDRPGHGGRPQPRDDARWRPLDRPRAGSSRHAAGGRGEQRAAAHGGRGALGPRRGGTGGVDPVDGRRRALSLGLRDRWRGRRGYPGDPRGGNVGDACRHPPLRAGRRGTRRGRAPGPGARAARRRRRPGEAVHGWTRSRDASMVGAGGAAGGRGGPRTGCPRHGAFDPAGRRPGLRRGRRGRDRARLRAGRRSCYGDGRAGHLRRVDARGVPVARDVRADDESPRVSRPPTAGRSVLDRFAQAQESIRRAHAAGVPIAAGTDFGGGSGRANHLAWEVESLVDAGTRAVGGARRRDVAGRRAARDPRSRHDPRRGPGRTSCSCTEIR